MNESNRRYSSTAYSQVNKDRHASHTGHRATIPPGSSSSTEGNTEQQYQPVFVEKLKIPLDKKIDRNGQIYYMAKLEFPGNITFDNGVAFFIYTSESGHEEIQIGCLKKKQVGKDYEINDERNQEE